MFVLAFDRDWTVDVNPHPRREAVPLDWIQYWAHNTDHEVWAIGNQDLVEEADIPGTVESVRRRDGDIDALGEQDDAGYYEWWPTRAERLDILASLFPDADEYIVVDDLDLSDVDGWNHYHAWDFVEAIRCDEINLDLPPSQSLRTDGGYKSEEAVRDVLDSGWLFEVTWRDDGGERTHLVTHREPHRPSMKPLKGPPVFYFESLAGDDTHKIRFSELVDVTSVSFDQVPSPLTGLAISALRGVVKDNPSAVSLAEVESALSAASTAESVEEEALHLALIVLRERDDAFEALGGQVFTLLQESDLDIGRGILKGTILQAQDSPETIARYVPTLATLAAESSYQEGAVRCLVMLAEDDPTHALDAVPALATAVKSDDVDTREWAIYGLSTIADEYPEEVYPTVDALIDAMQDESESIRANALSTLGRITSSYPDAAAPVTADLAELLNDDNEKVRNNAAGLMADIAQQYPEVVIEYANQIAECLDDPNTQAQINASAALLAAGEADPETIRDQHEHLEAALDDSNATVRENACALAGNARAPVSVEKLRNLRESDPDESVRERAAWAVSRLS